MKKILLPAFCIAFLSGCASMVDPNPMGDPSLKNEATEPLICKDKEQCDIYWQRAQIWISQNSAWKVRMSTDTIIETYSPTSKRGYLSAYKIEKWPQENGKYKIMITPYCDKYVRSCIPKPYEAAVSFKRFVKNND